MSSIVVAGDTSGSITLQAPGVAGSAVLTLPTVSGTVLTTATGQTLTAPVLGTPASGNLSNCTGVQYTGFKNRIINGGMVIDQRNAGASVTVSSGTIYTLDRWNFELAQASKISVQRNAGSVTPPPGFTNYFGITSLSAYSILSGDYFNFRQLIEGYNIADLAWGTANASSVTVSFWVRSSLTGTFGGAIKNEHSNYNYPFSYTISSANTWEQKSIIIAGPTSGTWDTTTSVGLQLYIGLGTGSQYGNGTAGAWTTSNFVTVTGATSVVGTNGATFYITGVQLEKGSTATSFDYRPYGTELSLCQRYYEKSYDQATVAGSVTPLGNVVAGGSAGTTTTSFISCNPVRFQVIKRATPTITLYDPAGASGVVQRWQLGVSNTNGQPGTAAEPSQNGFLAYSGNGSAATGVQLHFTASAEL